MFAELLAVWQVWIENSK